MTNHHLVDGRLIQVNVSHISANFFLRWLDQLHVSRLFSFLLFLNTLGTSLLHNDLLLLYLLLDFRLLRKNNLNMSLVLHSHRCIQIADAYCSRRSEYHCYWLVQGVVWDFLLLDLNIIIIGKHRDFFLWLRLLDLHLLLYLLLRWLRHGDVSH